MKGVRAAGFGIADTVSDSCGVVMLSCEPNKGPDDDSGAGFTCRSHGRPTLIPQHCRFDMTSESGQGLAAINSRINPSSCDCVVYVVGRRV